MNSFPTGVHMPPGAYGMNMYPPQYQQAAASVPMAAETLPQRQPASVAATRPQMQPAATEVNESETQQNQPSESSEEQKKPPSDEDGNAEMKGEEHKDDDSNSADEWEDEDVTDWYDATVIGFSSETGVSKVRFVGDDDTVYSMKLKPSIVRPCVQAWVKRSNAILEGHYEGQQGFDFGAWEKQLPVDTATLQDQRFLDHEWKGALATISGTGTTTSTTTDVSSDSLAKDRKDIVRLCFLVQSQIYLRSKLAPAVQSGESGAMSDAYLNHLVKCLKDLQQLCVWYEDCYSLFEKVVLTAAPAPEVDANHSESQQEGGTPLYATGSSLFNVEYIRGYCLEKGRPMINTFLATDFSRAGSKRRPVTLPAPLPARKTKRRKGYKASGFLESRENHEDDDILLEEGAFMSLKSVKKFVGKVHREKWYVAPLLRMLEHLCSEVQEPMRLWKQNVNVILGEEVDSDDDDTSSSEDENENGNEIQNTKEADEMSNDESARYFNFEEVSSCLDSVRNNRVLAKFDLSQWTNKLRKKLAGIEAFEADVWRAIPHIVDEVGQSTKKSDQVLARLQEAKVAAISTNHHVKNIDPLGQGTSRLTRSVIDNAIAVREWVLDLRHVDLVRERVSFVQDVVSRAPMLPHVPAPPHRLVDESLTSAMTSRLGQAMSRIQSLSSKLYSHVQVFSRYENIVTESSSVQLRSKPEVRAALDELRATPVVSLVEEKLSIRWDVLKWRDSAQGPLDNIQRNGVKFDVLEGLKEQLDAILSGSSSSRTEILNGLEKNPAIDNNIRQFARSEIELFCAEQASTVEQLYLKANDWKTRADSIIMALRIHGNPTAGSSLSGGQKTAAMVDLKRVDDLLAEYDELGSTMDERRTRLSSIRKEAVSWCTSVEKIIDGDNNVLERLTVARDTRPKGVLMEPARHVVDSWVEALQWHNRLKDALCALASSSASRGGSDNADGDTLSALIAEKIYPLMVEGQEVISSFSRHAQGVGSFLPDDALRSLSRFPEYNKPTRTVSVAKLETSQLGNTILSRLVDRNRDATQGSPLLCLLFLTWRVAVIDLIQRQRAKREDEDDDTEQGPSLEEAKQLSALRPQLPQLDSQSDATMDDGSLPFHRLFSRVETTEVARFRQLISDGERVESDTRAILPTTKEVVRGSFDKTDSVREHLATLKKLQADFKSRVQDRTGLILSSALEESLDSVVKDVAWLVRTFPYAALHSDTVPEVDDNYMSDDTDRSEKPQSVAIPWEVLVSLHDRLPDPITGPGGDCARVSLRVEELFEAAKTWQDEVTSQMSLSFRGGPRRRVPGAPTAETEDAPKINMGRLAQLAQHPILARVSMPREAAVRRVLDRAREFEESLAGLLNADFEGNLADKTPYPESDSLVGKNGDFLLFRLTGSTLFEALEASLKQMSEIAVDVLADTPGKAAFDWIVKAVAWIEDLKSAVENTSPFKGAGSDKLTIPSSDAKRLLGRGNDLFLEFTDDLRRTLAVHKISLSTNKQTERLTVVIGKGGALHSLGGTAIKWCPLLLDWLKADVERTADWEAKVGDATRAFQAMIEKEKVSPSYDRETVYRCVQFREKVSLLLDQGRDSLVVSPQKTSVTSLLALQTKLDSRADSLLLESERSLGLDVKTLVKSRFEDGGPAVEDRYSLLEALLKRRELDEEVAKSKGDKTPQRPTGVPTGPTPRDKARSILERALRKGIQMMGINDPESSLFCALKACEIEEAMFAAFRQELGSRSVTEKYREKLRSMRYNLEDTKNPTLCPRVLVGEISVAQLVTMTSEEMASQKVKLKKAKAEEESKKNIILNPGATKPKEAAPARTVKGLLESSLKSFAKPSQASRKPALKMPPKAASLPPAPRPSPPHDKKLFAASPSPRQGKATLKLSSLVSQKLPAPPLDVKTSRQEAAAFLPTPPSLALATSTPPPLAVAPAPAPATSRCVLNSNGTDTFSISVADATRTFKAKLILADESHRTRVQELMPPLLAEKGRNRIDAFSSFLRGKLESGRWTAIPMRLTTVSDSSASDYKKYYKDYEKKERISMIGVGKESRLFLVTPKFHSAAKPLKFENRNSTYAVLLVRSRKFSD